MTLCLCYFIHENVFKCFFAFKAKMRKRDFSLFSSILKTSDELPKLLSSVRFHGKLNAYSILTPRTKLPFNFSTIFRMAISPNLSNAESTTSKSMLKRGFIASNLSSY